MFRCYNRFSMILFTVIISFNLVVSPTFSNVAYGSTLEKSKLAPGLITEPDGLRAGDAASVKSSLLLANVKEANSRLQDVIGEVERGHKSFIEAVKSLTKAVADAALDLVRIPVKVPKVIVREIVDGKMGAAEIIDIYVSDDAITDSKLSTAKATLKELINVAEAGQYMELQERIISFSKEFNYISGELSRDQREIWHILMIAKSALARDVAAYYLEKGNLEAYKALVKEALDIMEAFIEAEIKAGNQKESSRKKIEAARRYIDEWLTVPDMPERIRIGIIRGMLEGRSDDLIFAFGNGWRKFGTAGIRNQAVNSEFASVLLFELEEFAQDPHASILVGPNIINVVVLLQQTAVVKHLASALQAYVESNGDATEVSLKDLMTYSELYKRAGLDEQPRILDGLSEKVVIALPDEFKENLQKNSMTFSFDSRINGEYWAHILAADLLDAGISVNLFENVSGMPSLTLAAKRFRSIFGFLISASHSEPNYNGFKFVVGHLMSQVNEHFQTTIMAFRSLIEYSDINLAMADPEIKPDDYLEEHKENLTWLGRSNYPGKFKAKRRDFYTETYKQLKRRSPLAALEAVNPDFAAKFREARASFKFLFTAFSGAACDNAESLIEFLKDAGYLISETVKSQTDKVDGRFLAFIKGWTTGMPDPGNPEACATNLAEFILQVAGDDLSNLDLAIEKVNTQDLFGQTDPDSDRAGMVTLLSDEEYPGATDHGNMKAPTIKAVERAMKEKGYAPEIIDAVKTVLAAELDDKLHLTANDAWAFLSYWKLRLLEEQGMLERDKLYIIIKSHVTTPALEGVAEYFRERGYSVHVVDTFVGFTLLAERADALFNFSKIAWEAAGQGVYGTGVDKLLEVLPRLEEAYLPIVGQIEPIDDLMVLLREFAEDVRKGREAKREALTTRVSEILENDIVQELEKFDRESNNIFLAANAAIDLSRAISFNQGIKDALDDYEDRVDAISPEFQGAFKKAFELADQYYRSLKAVKDDKEVVRQEADNVIDLLDAVGKNGRVTSLYAQEGMKGAKKKVSELIQREKGIDIGDIEVTEDTILVGAYDGRGKLIGALKAQIIRDQVRVDGPVEEILQIDFMTVEPEFKGLWKIEKHLMFALFNKMKKLRGEYLPISVKPLEGDMAVSLILYECLFSKRYSSGRPLVGAESTAKPPIRKKYADKIYYRSKSYFTYDWGGGILDEKSDEEIRTVLGMVSYQDIVAGVEESNGYGEFGQTLNMLGKPVEVVNEHIREKDGMLALFEFMEIMVYLKVIKKTFHTAYLEMMQHAKRVTSTFNSYFRYVGAAGEDQKVGTIQSIEKELAFFQMKALEYGDEKSFFDGRYRFNMDKEPVEIFWGGKYDDYYLRFPEEGIRFNLVTEYEGVKYKITVTYRPSGTGMENRDYNWAEGEIKPEYTLADVEKVRRDVEIVKAQLVRDFFGDEGVEEGYLERGEFGGLLLALNEGGFNRFREVFAKALDIESFEFSEWEEKLLQQTIEFAATANTLREATPDERDVHAAKLNEARKANYEIWSKFMESPEVDKYPVKVKFNINDKVVEIPRCMVVSWAASVSYYLLDIIEDEFANQTVVLTTSEPSHVASILENLKVKVNIGEITKQPSLRGDLKRGIKHTLAALMLDGKDMSDTFTIPEIFAKLATLLGEEGEIPADVVLAIKEAGIDDIEKVSLSTLRDEFKGSVGLGIFEVVDKTSGNKAAKYQFTEKAQAMGAKALVEFVNTNPVFGRANLNTQLTAAEITPLLDVSRVIHTSQRTVKDPQAIFFDVQTLLLGDEELVDGIEKVLQELREEGRFKLFVVGDDELVGAFGKTKMNEYFDDVLKADNPSKKAAAVEQKLADEDLNHQQAIFIGIHHEDILAMNELDIIKAIFVQEPGFLGKILEAGPDYLISGPVNWLAEYLLQLGI